MKALRFVLLAIGCAMVAVLWARWTHPLWTPPHLQQIAWPSARPGAAPKPATPEDLRAAVLARLADAPAYAPFFDRLRTEFPADYVGLIDQETAAMARGGHVPNPDRMMADAMRRMRQTRGVLAAQAEAGPLDSMFAAQGATLDVLGAESPSLCVDFLYGGSSPEFMLFAAKNRDLVARLAMADLTAIASGRSSHIDRAPPAPEDFDKLAVLLKAQGFSEDEVSAVLDGKTFDPPLPDSRLCDAGRAYLHAVADLPEDVRLRIYALSATLLARS